MSKLFSTLKKYSFLVLFICSLFFGLNVFAQNNPTEVIPPVIAPTGTPVIGSYTGNCDPSKDENCYQFLEALPTSEGDLTSVNTGVIGQQGKGLGGFIMFAFEIGVGIAGVLGVVMLTIYGFQYAANDKNIATFEVLKEKITKVILGLLLLLGIFVILNTINPDLLIVEPDINDVNLAIDVGGDNASPIFTPQQITQTSASFRQFAASHGIICPGSGGAAKVPEIARSMVGKITYNQTLRNKPGPSDTWYLDCSFFVHTVLSVCAGLPSPGQSTGLIFPGTEKVANLASIQSTLKPGDLLGWTPQEDRRGNGHVVMYLGDGQMIEVQGGGKKNGIYPPKKAVLIRPISAYSNRIKHVKRLR